MGTRGLTKVIYNEETVVAQYGQWDHYPEGQGLCVLNFVRNLVNLSLLRQNLDKCYWVTQETHEAIVSEFTGSSSMGKGWMTLEEGNAFNEAYPSLSRDTGGEILEVIAKATAPVPLQNQEYFEDDGMCEGVYTVDFDNNEFHSLYDNAEVWFSFGELPTDEEYLKAFKKEMEEA